MTIVARAKSRVFARLIAFALPLLSLTGCIEMTTKVAFTETGAAASTVEVGIMKEFADMLGSIQAEANKGGKRSKTKEPPMDFASLCKSGFKDLDDRAATKPKGKAAAKAATPAPAATTPQGQVETRGDMVVCVLTETIADPVQHYAKELSKAGLPSQVADLKPLETGDGYRYRSVFRVPDLMAKDKKLSKEDRAGMAMMANLIPARAEMIVIMSGTRVEKTNGTISPDGRAVTWRIPFAKVFDMRPGAEDIRLEADVFFK